MKGRRSDRLRLLDMQGCIQRILDEYTKLGPEKLPENDLRYDGLVRLISIIGEAAYQLTRELRAAHPEVPWRQIIATRHIIVHDYAEVDEDRIWDIIINFLPKLNQQPDTIINALPA